MKCKDSDVFALERYVDQVLTTEGWKNSLEIDTAIKSMRDEQYHSWFLKNPDTFMKTEQSEELFMDDVMERLCQLFPMKYKKQSIEKSLTLETIQPRSINNRIHPETKACYSRTWGFEQ